MSNIISIYDKLAKYYPLIFGLQHPQANTKQDCDFIEKLFSKHKVNPRIILDLACGMGRIACELEKRGYNVTGVDGSKNMIQLARKQCPKIKFINAKIENFNAKADAAIIWWTTYNYLDSNALFKLVKTLHKNISYVILDSSNYLSDKRPSYTVSRLEKNGIFVEQKRKWWAKNNKRFIKYTYTIKTESGIKKINYTDISYWYSLNDLRKVFDKKFVLLDALGDYKISNKYNAPRSKRLITVWKCKK